ncbi:MAG: cupredoxin domain-containing protein [Chloroflexota bacterium]|nr:cupredoxin domain-containing protein [Chloroflexota bacterium]
MRGELVALGMLVALIAGVVGGMAFLDRVYEQSDNAITVTAQVPTEGGFEPDVVRVKAGEVVRLRLTSRDVTHGFYLPDFNVNAGPISPGKYKTVEFVADKVGAFTFYCNVLCSKRHGAMNGTLIVEP